MRNLKATKVVATDQHGRPVNKPARKWAVKLNKKKGLLTLTCGSHKRQYSLATDLLYLAVAEEKSEIALGKTLGRMALTGLATNGFANGKGLAGGIMDFAVRGAEQNVSWRCELVLADLSVVSFEATPAELQGQPTLLSYASDAARERLQGLNDLLRRLKLDGERVLPEIDAALVAIKEKIDQLRAVEASGVDFAARDEARSELRRLESELQDREAVKGALIYEFASEKLGGGQWLFSALKVLLWIVIFVIAVLGFIVWASRTPAGAKAPTQSLQPPTALSVPSSHPEPLVIKEIATSTAADQRSEAPLPPPVTFGPAVAVSTSNPSFDCNRAASAVEKTICSRSALGEADRELAAIYKQALARSPTPDMLKKEQNTWRRTRRDACADEQCVMRAYRDRTAELR